MAAEGMQPADRGQCWRELAAYHQQQQAHERRSLSGWLGSLLRVAGAPLWDMLVSLVFSVLCASCLHVPLWSGRSLTCVAR